MSDDDKDIDVESDCEEEDDSLQGSATSSGRSAEGNHANKRAHHNALERKRRDHIKDSFTSLRDCVPALQGEKSSRAQILKKASDYIDFMRKKISSHMADIDDLQRQNELLDTQIKALEKAKYTGNYAAMSGECSGGGSLEKESETESDSDCGVYSNVESKRKRLKS